VVLAHTTVGGTIEIELLLVGFAFVAAAFFFRPSQTGNPRASVITLVVGIGLIVGSFVLPQIRSDRSDGAVYRRDAMAAAAAAG
jgi:hypothetical protein